MTMANERKRSKRSARSARASRSASALHKADDKANHGKSSHPMRSVVIPAVIFLCTIQLRFTLPSGHSLARTLGDDRHSPTDPRMAFSSFLSSLLSGALHAEDPVAMTRSILSTETIVFPPEPDADIIPRLKKNIRNLNVYENHLERTSCTPTVQFQLTIQTIGYVAQDGGNGGNAGQPQTQQQQQQVRYILQSLDEHGQPKTMGGDEFYPVYFDAGHVENQPQSSNPIPTAAAHVQDNGDGTYTLDFEQPPYEAPMGPGAGHGSMQLYYGYTCGIARLTRPDKKGWDGSAHSFAVYAVANITTPPEIQPFQYPPEISGDQNRTGTPVDLSSYDKIVCCGDSMMRNFCGVHHKPAPEFQYANLKAIGNFGPFFRHDTWRDIAPDEINKTYGEDLLPDGDKRIAMLLGSATWDIAAYEFPPQDNNFTDSMQMYRDVIAWARETYPHVTVIWKLPQAFHMHVVGSIKLIKMAKDRLQYTSNANAKYLYDRQKVIMAELGIPTLDMWNTSYLSSHRHRRHDVAHFDGDQNHYFADMYYMNASMKQLGPHR